LSRAVVSFSSPKNLNPFGEGEVSRDDLGATLVALRQEIKSQLASGPLERYKAEFNYLKVRLFDSVAAAPEAAVRSGPPPTSRLEARRRAAIPTSVASAR